ncbi:MAG: NAD(P)H-hydrate epimerase [Candidatus Marinimicrobia bacterium]|nr:NAD(P)H-hydrate epimerase [Candidatus Neomarinimicrobiota bacterium]MCF7903777.1 NAD(P)H-hydrate epimerase [Candidatus Neomarinimicrobiota bacterium]
MIPRHQTPLPELTVSQMMEVDRIMIEDYGITLVQMMENAGYSLSLLAKERFLLHDLQRSQVIILAGSGGNGGGALVAARRLANFGVNVQVWLSKPSHEFKGVPGHQLNILFRQGVAIIDPPDRPKKSIVNLVIDGLIGYSLKGDPRGLTAEMITWANHQTADILALDVPSGYNTTSGVASETVVEAIATMTLALPKLGLSAVTNKPFVGELYLADISVPPRLYKELGIDLGGYSLFAEKAVVRID